MQQRAHNSDTYCWRNWRGADPSSNKEVKAALCFERHWYWQEMSDQIWFSIKGMAWQFINAAIISSDCWCCPKSQSNILLALRQLQFTCVGSQNSASWRIARSQLEIANLVIMFFPLNANCNCQPLEQGIIWSLTAQIQKAQLHTLLSEYEISLKAQDENLTTTFPLNDHIHMYNALMWLKEAYSNIHKNVTQHCLSKQVAYSS